MSDLSIGGKTDKTNSIQDNKDTKEKQLYKVKKAKAEIERICKKYDVSIYVNPIIHIMPELSIKLDKQKSINNVAQTRKKLDKIFKKFKTFMRIDPNIEIRPKSSGTIRRIIPDAKE